jgi:HAD superfamily hydrolase (TIGR01509 family)
MSGGLFVRALRRELGRDLTPALVDTLQRAHADAYELLVDQVRPLPGSRELLATLSAEGVPWAIATSGSREVASRTLRIFELPADVPIVTRTDVAHAKPNPDLFLEAARRLDVEPRKAFVVGDSIWDLLAAQRAGSLGIGVLSGGYGADELQRSGAYRVYADPADLLAHLDELGIRVSDSVRSPE